MGDDVLKPLHLAPPATGTANVENVTNVAKFANVAMQYQPEFFIFIFLL